ncbi:hypothetical protein [Ralstonia pseudosolanacearum]|uniref:Prophage protein n=1 Tax=Ralstonia nicotianae (strain ATCC BAA-1114 / GMI1000) TaxID=267608 RepID=Q8XWJ7_RALN1|nr:hypothetical protein [Ralstonia pseudosolanacearum]AST27995.1 hypothetical protein CDC45_12610 [Ralstonia pseudosolanacearum]MCQ4681758.1 hypothetical protein [Ralstonia pseudosolanacearum]MDC6285096.1 hypothetical protein [Ralstonia pseudosolanacearum]CAD16184.1 putative prophage protein [Ralstonia pseudosolanacearum GMI1000]
MRLVTMEQWDAFSALMEEIHEAMGKMIPIVQGLAVLAANVDPMDPAQESIPINALRAGAEVKKQAEELMERFEVMARICTGEKRKPGESLMEFIERFGAMDEGEIHGAMARNGVRLVGRRK